MDKDHFIEKSTEKGHDTKKLRKYLVSEFEKIQTNIECGHQLPTSYRLADALLLQQDVEGPTVECGCFKGGMSAKLSIVCKEIGKEHHLIDSFQGLPCEELAIYWRGGENLFKEGTWKGTFPEVTKNIEDFGASDVCKFHQGWFKDIIHEIDIYPSFIFIDVDIISSALTCIKHFWSRLQGSRFYTHESCFKTYMDGILDEDWWKDTFNESVPKCIGRVDGFYDAKCLAYLEKA